MPDSTCPVCGSPWFDVDDDGLLACCDCSERPFNPTPSNPVPTPSLLVPDGVTGPHDDPVPSPRPATPVGGRGGDGVAPPVKGREDSADSTPVPGRGQR